MTDSRNPSDSPPPPQDPFQRFSQPWPRSEKEEDNPFIQFRRYADQSFGSLFSGVSQLCQLANSTPENFEKQLDNWVEKIIKNTKMEEGRRKAMEQDIEEAKQAINKSQDKSIDLWWTRGNAAKCPALSDLSPRASKCPAMFDSNGPKTELDAYNRVDASPYDWNSGLGWDGKVKKSQEQAYDQVKQSMFESTDHARKDRRQEQRDHFRPDHPIWPHEGASLYTPGSARWMDPFTTPCNTIPWLVLSSYSPIFLCNSQQPVARCVQFTSGIDHPFTMKVLHKGPSPFTSHVDEKMERALPWADAFEDLISLEKTGKMVDRGASTFQTPKTWIHDMVKRGSLGPAWGFNDQGQLTQKEELYDKDFVNAPVRSRRRLEIANAGRIVDAINHQTAQQATEAGCEWSHTHVPSESESAVGGKELESPKIDSPFVDLEDRSRRRRGDARHAPTGQTSLDDILRHTKGANGERSVVEGETNVDVADQIMRLGLESLTAAIPAIISSGQFEPGESTLPSSSSKTWSEHSTGKEESRLISILTRTETTTLPDGNIQTKRVLNKRFADGREENEESVDTSPPRRSITGLLGGSNKESDREESKSIARRLDNSDEPSMEVKPTPTPKKSGWFWT